MLGRVKDISVRVKLIKVPTHSEITGNDMADFHAKELSYRIFKGDIAAPM